MGLREDFVRRVKAPGGVVFRDLCVEFGISRKTGYKWLKRYEEAGLQGLEDMSRRPAGSPLETSAEMALAVVALRRERPRWGPKKLRASLLRTHPAELVPSERTIDRIIERAGEPRKQRKKRFHVVRDTPVVQASSCHDVWTVDFKGWWRTEDGARIEPLTVRDAFSRYVLAAEILESTTAEAVRDAFIALFRRHGRPKAIQCDNGSPFGCTSAPAGLTRLSAWWVSLGINVIFSRPGHPQDNGAHERMHLDIRFDVEELAADDVKAQRNALTRWRHDYNHHRPHEALDQRVPADLFVNSPRRHSDAVRLHVYPPGWIVRRVADPGRISVDGGILRISHALTGYTVGLEPLPDGKHRVWFLDLDVGVVDLSTDTRRPRRATPDWGRGAARAAHGR